MRLTRFAAIGRAPIHCAIGLAENYKEISSIQDLNSPECLRCEKFLHLVENAHGKDSTYYKEALSVCANCQKRQKTIYINEKNRYGTRERLNCMSILLFMYLHLCTPSSIGVINGFHIPTAAKFLQCDQKTVHASLKCLQKKKYITYLPDARRGYYIVLISGYMDYFKKASEGGRGYIQISNDLLKQLIDIKKLNTIRLFLRIYFDVDSMHRNNVNDLIISKAMEELRRYLPKYLKPRKIESLLSCSQDLFEIHFGKKYTFKLNSSYFARIQKKTLYHENEQRLLEHIEEANQYIIKRRDDWISISAIPEYLKKAICRMAAANFYEPIVLTDADKKDLIQMSIQYSYEEVIAALHTIWDTYQFKDLKLYGALIRTIIEDNNLAAA